MRKRTEILLLLALAVVIIAVCALIRPGDTGTDNEGKKTEMMRSSYSVYPTGYKAAYLTLQQLDYRVQRQLRPFAMLPDRGLLIVGDPDRPQPTAYERRKLLAWVRRGNYALVTVEAHRAFLTNLLSDTPEKPKSPAQGTDGKKRTKNDADDVPPIVKELIESDKPKKDVPITTATPITGAFFTGTAPSLRVRTEYRFDLASEEYRLMRKVAGNATPVYKDAHGVVVLYSRIGEGGILWCSSPWSFSNAGLAEGNNLDLLLALADRQSRAPVIFDEYHQGVGADMSMWSLAPPMLKFGILQLGVVLLLLLITVSWRFGPPRAPAEERYTRSRAEYLTSMAALLARARATHVVRDRLEALLRRELSRRLGVPPKADLAEFQRANAANPVVNTAELERVLRQFAEVNAQERPNQEVLLQLTREMHRMLYRKSAQVEMPER